MSKLFSILILLFLGIGSVHSFQPDIEQDLKDVYKKYKNLSDGKNAEYIPELAKVNPKLFGIAIVTSDGKIYSIGDAEVPFAIESISKIFSLAVALKDRGAKTLEAKVGVDPTGYPFNSVIAIEKLPNHKENPFVNSGAIQVTSMIQGKDTEEKWQKVFSLMEKTSNGKPYLGEKVYQSEMKTNQRNQAIALLLDSYGMMDSDPFDAVDRYTKACSVMITTKELAMMGSALANNGVNPATNDSLISPDHVRYILAVMTINGLYDTSGMWGIEVGLPAKSGVGGGILAVAPQKMAIAVFSPPLDATGNSVRAQKVIEELSNKWHLNLLYQEDPRSKQ